MFTVGITGGIGSGKSLVCAEFARLGFSVLSADEIAKELSSTDQPLRKRLTRLLGAETYLADGSYNRPYVASRIFTDPSLKARVEEAIHPRVERELARRLHALKKLGQRVALVEAALIFEAGYDRWLSGVLVVEADEAVRVGRLRSRGGLSDDEIRRRMAGQMDPATKADRADYIIKNNGRPDELCARVQFFATMFHAMAKSGTA
jgi:dephospho-CoA kinase